MSLILGVEESTPKVRALSIKDDVTPSSLEEELKNVLIEYNVHIVSKYNNYSILEYRIKQ